jgi:anti-anti-sigma regulatory factor
MSGSSSKEISEEIYHRIYRLIKRRLSAHTIAATLHLPLRTVLSVINRFERSESTATTPSGSPDTNPPSPSDSDYLDIYFYPKTRYAILDLVGTLSDTHTGLLKTELDKAIATSWKAVAIRMSQVHGLSEAAANIILTMKSGFVSLERFLGILDPSSEIEQALAAYNIEGSIPIFGTERAFEDTAFAKKGKLYARRTGNSAG